MLHKELQSLSIPIPPHRGRRPAVRATFFIKVMKTIGFDGYLSHRMIVSGIAQSQICIGRANVDLCNCASHGILTNRHRRSDGRCRCETEHLIRTIFVEYIVLAISPDRINSLMAPTNQNWPSSSLLPSSLSYPSTSRSPTPCLSSLSSSALSALFLFTMACHVMSLCSSSACSGHAKHPMMC